MLVAIFIKSAFIIGGVLAALLSINSLIKRSTTPGFSVIWILFGAILIFTGIFIEPYNWTQMIGVPTIIFFGLLGLAAIFFFWYLTKKVDELSHKMQETAIQLTLLTDENKSLKNHITNISDDLASTKSKIKKYSNHLDFNKDTKITGKKILFVNNTLSTGGAEKVLLSLMKKFVANNNIVHLFVVTGMGELVHQLPEEVKLLNENFDEESVLSLKGKRKLTNKVAMAERTSFTGIRLFGYQVRALINMIRDGKIRAEKLAWRALAETAPIVPQEYDLAIAFTEGAATYYTADKVAAAKKVAFVHTPYEYAGYTKQLDKNSYDSFDEILVVSDSVRRSFLNVHPECINKVHVYENNLDYKEIERLSKLDLSTNHRELIWSNLKKKRFILTVARLVALKSYGVIIEAASLLKQKGYDFIWLALGEGEDRTKIQELINSKGLKDNFILVGNVANPYPFMSQCDVYVHVTSYEGKSVAVREAKALECPIVLSDVEGNKGQIVDGVSGLYTSLNPREVAEKISVLLDDTNYSKSLGRAARIDELSSHGYNNHKSQTKL